MAQFQLGDVVQLKGGGPFMAVTKTGYERGEVYCEWFVEHAEVKGHRFPCEALKKIDDES